MRLPGLAGDNAKQLKAALVNAKQTLMAFGP